MGKNPAFQFYPGDWSRDMIEHPLEVEGFWIRVCCILWWAPARGSATKPANIWAKTTAVSAQKCRSLFDYLHKQNIADVEIDNDTYKVTSRRMVRDEHIRNVRSLAGSLGGNPKIKGYPKSENLVKQNTLNQPESLVKQNPTPSSSSSSSTTKIKTYKGFSPPDMSDVLAYCQERKNQVNSKTFIDHYTSNGWMVGKNKMKDWKAAVRTWESRGGDNGRGTTNSQGRPGVQYKEYAPDAVPEISDEERQRNLTKLKEFIR